MAEAEPAPRKTTVTFKMTDALLEYFDSTPRIHQADLKALLAGVVANQVANHPTAEVMFESGRCATPNDQCLHTVALPKNQ